MNPQSQTSSAQSQTDESQASKHAFPQVPLESCIAIAQSVHEVGGNECTWDQLAAYLKLRPKSGNFRQKVLSARRFGLLTYASGSVQLTSLGIRSLNAEADKNMRVESFLFVFLFKTLYENLQGMPIPPNEAIERKLGALGLAKTQTKKARQVFLSSAQYAGFRDLASDRLVLPVLSPHKSEDESAIESEEKDVRKEPQQQTSEINPLVLGLLAKMPNEGEDWSISEFVIWLKTLQLNLAVIYGQPDLGEIEISKPNQRD